MGLRSCRNGHLFSGTKYGNICPYCRMPLEEGGLGNEVGQFEWYSETYLDELTETRPVVGWLVCIHGYSKGKDYRILPGKNFIGSDPDMDICILGDDKEIKPRNHAVILYDTESNSTRIRDDKGIVRLLHNNDKVDTLDTTIELEIGDYLQIGNSKFIFVPLCGDSEGKGFIFKWNEFDKED